MTINAATGIPLEIVGGSAGQAAVTVRLVR
jgi:hypothetical protein